MVLADPGSTQAPELVSKPDGHMQHSSVPGSGSSWGHPSDHSSMNYTSNPLEPCHVVPGLFVSFDCHSDFDAYAGTCAYASIHPWMRNEMQCTCVGR